MVIKVVKPLFIELDTEDLQVVDDVVVEVVDDVVVALVAMVVVRSMD